jgi:soluble cytochrome b562
MKTLSQNWVLAALAATWLAAQNVGIGTTTPLTRLHVAEGDIFLGDAAGNNGFILHSRSHAGYDFFQISTRTGGTYEWSKGITLVRSSGNVGIGTTTPSCRLHVAGDVCVTGDLQVSYIYTVGIHATWICDNVVFAGCSDQRWKTNIKPIQNALDNVLKMQGVTYHWKVDEYPDKHFPEGEQVGFIAQEIEKVYPQVVFTDKDGYKSVDYSKLTPVLVEAIKEQQKIIEELQKAIQQLQEENSQIKQANAQLSAEIKMLNEKVDNLINSLSNDKKLGYR